MRQVSQSDARLVVSVNSPGTELSAAALAALAAAAPEIVDLNLADTALDDAGLAAIGALPAATHLRLARNQLTDASLSALARGSPQLQHLNLYGNSGITDAGLETLGEIATLRELYLWQTGVSARCGREASRAQSCSRRRCRLLRAARHGSLRLAASRLTPYEPLDLGRERDRVVAEVVGVAARAETELRPIARAPSFDCAVAADERDVRNSPGRDQSSIRTGRRSRPNDTR